MHRTVIAILLTACAPGALHAAPVMLVDGDVSKDLGALRRVVTVVSDGYVMDADALRKAAGYSGRPK